MINYKVKLDERGVVFNTGTKKKPGKLFSATFTSYTFLRPGKVARMIAERAGLTIQKSRLACWLYKVSWKEGEPCAL
jgi:hypothetical protein